MSTLANHRYLKMNGLGNEIVVLDLRESRHVVLAEEARAIAKNPASNFDQLMVIHAPKTPGTDAFIRIYNTDGSESGACGNGTRCVAWAMLYDPVMQALGDPARQALTLQTKAGILNVTREAELSFTVDMGAPKLHWTQIPLAEEFRDTRAIELQIGPIDNPILHSPAVVNMGNPHAVFFVEDIESYQLDKIGPLLENHPVFPERANISLASILSRDHIRLRVWERGAGLTRACGSGACAALVAAVRKKLTNRTATVTLPGGDLMITWLMGEDEDTQGHVLMTGPVELEHEGHFAPALFTDSR